MAVGRACAKVEGGGDYYVHVNGRDRHPKRPRIGP